MDNTLQIKTLQSKIGQLMIELGLKQVNNAIGDFTDTQGTFDQFTKALTVLQTTVAQLDTNYYFTNCDNWNTILGIINPIIQSMNWVIDRRDCDKQADFVVGLVAYMFELNTIRPLYCSVYRVSDGAWAYDHYCCVFVTDDGSAWIYDYDNGNGMWQKITSATPIIGNCKYVLHGVK
jgi:hypothetical protein